MSLKFVGSNGEQVQFAEDFEELADLEEFLEYQDQLHLEEAGRKLLDVDIEVKNYWMWILRTISWTFLSSFFFLFFSLSNQSHLPRKSHTYRIQQPRTVI